MLTPLKWYDADKLVTEISTINCVKQETKNQAMW